MPDTPVLTTSGLGFRYGRGDWLFENLDFDISPGEVIALIGPNARGKTTLLTCLAGVREPVAGKITVNGAIGYVPQNHGAEYPFSAHEIVVMGRAQRIRAWSTPSRADEAAAWEALERVGMADVGKRAFRSLSGGQRQLVLMARALVCEPALIILDEPTSALDLRNQRRVLTVIRSLAAEGIAVMLSTHDPTHALNISDRTLVMDTELTLAPTTSLLTEERLSALYRTPVRTEPIDFASGTRPVVAPDLLADVIEENPHG